MKKRLLCLFMSICMCLSLSIFAYADNSVVLTQTDAPQLTISSSPENAIAIAKNLTTNSLFYYQVFGDILSDSANTIRGMSSSNSSVEPNVILPPNDDRYRVNELQYPYTCIGHLVSTYNYADGSTSSFAGTAFMISPYVAVTAAHNTYDHESEMWASQITFAPGISGDSNFIAYFFGSTVANEVAISYEWYINETNDYDWAVITFRDDIGNDCGFLGLHYFSQDPSGLEVVVSGYPASFLYNQYAHAGPLQTCTTTRLTYLLDVDDGQSGSPILYYSNGQWQSIGVHHSDQQPNGNLYVYRNFGSRYTTSLYNFLYAYKSRPM